MKKTVLTILTFCFLISFGITSKAEIITDIIPQNQSPSIMEKAFLRNLGGTILEIMSKHGDNQLYTFSRIERITNDITNDSYDVSLRVIGFEGPLNPPYKLIRMTIRIPGEKYTKYSIITYTHRYVSRMEFEKLTKYTVH